MSRKSKRDEEIAAICGPLGQCLRAVFTSHQAQQTLLPSLWHPSMVKCCTDVWSGGLGRFCLPLPTATGPLVPPLPLGRRWAALGGSGRAIFLGCFQQLSGAPCPQQCYSNLCSSRGAQTCWKAGHRPVLLAWTGAFPGSDNRVPWHRVSLPHTCLELSPGVQQPCWSRERSFSGFLWRDGMK